MSEQDVEQFENEGGAAAPEGEVASPESWSPSKEDFENIQRSVQGLNSFAQQMQQMLQAEEEGYEDPAESFQQQDMGRLVQRYVDTRLQPFQPVIQSAAQEQGDKRFNEIIDGLESQDKNLKGVDRKLAYMFAEAALPQVGNPMQAVQMGVRQAAEYTAQFKQQIIEDYKKSLQRRAPGDGDFGGSGEMGGDRVIPQAKSYDEVIERWSGQTEV